MSIPALAQMKKMEQETEFARMHQIGLPAILVTGTGNRGRLETQVTTAEPHDVVVGGGEAGDQICDKKPEDKEGKSVWEVVVVIK